MSFFEKIHFLIFVACLYSYWFLPVWYIGLELMTEVLRTEYQGGKGFKESDVKKCSWRHSANLQVVLKRTSAIWVPSDCHFQSIKASTCGNHLSCLTSGWEGAAEITVLCCLMCSDCKLISIHSVPFVFLIVSSGVVNLISMSPSQRNMKFLPVSQVVCWDDLYGVTNFGPWTRPKEPLNL